MIKLKDLLLERGMLSIFDFDDTLVTSDSWVYVKRPDGTEMQLYRRRRTAPLPEEIVLPWSVGGRD